MWTCEVLRFMLFCVVYSFMLKLRGVNKISRLKLVTHMQRSRESGALTQEHSWAPPPFRERNQEEVGGFLLCWSCVAPSRALRTQFSRLQDSPPCLSVREPPSTSSSPCRFKQMLWYSQCHFSAFNKNGSATCIYAQTHTHKYLHIRIP